jgi:AraC-like DNA-binding protein
MKLYIKNMVCKRCKMVVKTEIEKLGYHVISIILGEAEIKENLSQEQKSGLNKSLLHYGFELISERKGQLIEKIKNTVIESVHYSAGNPNVPYSEYLSNKLNHDYSSLSKLFSESEGITLEQYIISQKIERVKELLAYDELTISQIADQMNYSSNAHLSRQFKNATGYTPSAFKKLKHDRRTPLEEI